MSHAKTPARAAARVAAVFGVTRLPVPVRGHIPVAVSMSVAALGGIAVSAEAQPVHWLSAADGSWLDPLRWSSGMTPGINDDVVIDALLTDPDSHYTVSDVSGQVRSVRIESGAWVEMSNFSGVPTSEFRISEDMSLNGTGLFGIVGGNHHMSVDGDVRIGPQAMFAHVASSGNSTVSIVGDLVNDGFLPLRGAGFTRPINRLELGGRLINGASARIVQIGAPYMIEAEIHNAGVMQGLFGDFGRHDAHNINTGSILGGRPAFVGSTLSNHGTVASVLAPDPTDDQQFLDVSQIDATGVHVINSGQWFAGLTADTITLEDASAVRLVLSGSMFDPPGERFTAAASALLDGVLDLRWEYLGGGAESLVRDYFLVEAPSITGGFETVLMPPLADGFSASIVATDTQVILRVARNCTADLNGNGTTDSHDIQLFIDAFLDNDLLADLTGDGAINLDDIEAFVASFLAGCP